MTGRELIEMMTALSSDMSETDRMAVSNVMKCTDRIVLSTHDIAMHAQVEAMCSILTEIVGDSVLSTSRKYPIPQCRWIVGLYMQDRGYSIAEIARSLSMKRSALTMGIVKLKEQLLGGHDKNLQWIYEKFKDKLSM